MRAIFLSYALFTAAGFTLIPFAECLTNLANLEANANRAKRHGGGGGAICCGGGGYGSGYGSSGSFGDAGGYGGWHFLANTNLWKVNEAILKFLDINF